MAKNKIKFGEFQEILFWQQLNKQLIALKAQGRDIREDHHGYLQSFSFDNQLFSRITRAPLLDDIPLALITDFSEECFAQFKLDSWNSCLMQLIPQTLALDVEQALADAFVAAEKYDKKFPPKNKKNEGDEDDEELYGFIDEYLGVRERQGRNLPEIITSLYQLKTESVQRIMEISDYKSFLSRRENQLFLDLSKYDGRRETLTAYFENFCDQADSVISSVIQPSFTVDLDGLLAQKGNENNLKPSIKEFVNHEIAIVEKEYQLMEAFRSRARDKKYQSDVYEIAVCSLSPLSFLENPFPAV